MTSARETPAAEAEAIWKSFGRTKALQDVSVSVAPGECHALVGRNGAGKSTLVGVLTGLLKPDAGSVRLCGEPAPAWTFAGKQLDRRPQASLIRKAKCL